MKKKYSNKAVKNQIELEIWKRKLDRKPENLFKIVHKSKNQDMICEAVKELGKQKNKKALSLFIDLLKNKNPSIRTCAAIALANNPTQKAFQPLINAIKKHEESCSEFIYALEALDCHTEVEFLVDLFISKPNAPMVRINIIECFEGNSIKSIPLETGGKIKTSISNAIRKSKDKTDKYELHRFYEEAVKPKTQKL